MSQNQQLSASNMILDVLDALDLVLADMFALYVKTKNSHWHVSGPHFRDYHLLLDDQASQIFATTDVIAEWVRKLWPADATSRLARSPFTSDITTGEFCSRTGSTGPTVVSGSCSRPCKWASAVGLAMTRLMIDGREVQVLAGAQQFCRPASSRDRDPVFLLSRPAFNIAGNCRMCLVEVEITEAGRVMRDAGRPTARSVHTDNRKGDEGAARRHGDAADQPPARLPDLRSGRRCDMQDQAMAYGFDRGRYRKTSAR